MPTLSFPHTFTRGALAGQTFARKQEYNEALARSKGFSGETEARSAAIHKPPSQWTREEIRLYNKSTRVASRVARGESLSKAAKAEGIRPETVRKYRPGALERHARGYVASRGFFSGRGGAWVRVLTADGFEISALPRQEDRQLNARYLNTVGRVLSQREGVRTAARAELAGFRGKYVTDADGNRISFVTDLDQLRRLAEAGEITIEDIYPEGGQAGEAA